MQSAECGTISKTHAILFWLTFVVTFGAVGVAASWVFFTTLHDAHRARQWVPAQAKVDAFNGRVVEYHYTYGEAKYRGDRVGPVPFPVRIGDIHYERMASALEAAAKSGKPVTVWVNPRNPEESMHERELRWLRVAFMISFMLLFTGCAVAAVCAIVNVVRSPLERIPTYREVKSPAIFLWSVGLMWNAFNVPFAIAGIHDAVTEQQYGAIIAVFFLPIGIFILGAAIYVSMKERRTRPRAVDRIGIGRSDFKWKA